MADNQIIKTKDFIIAFNPKNYKGKIVKLSPNKRRAKEIIIPSEIDGIQIVAIRELAFANLPNLTKIIIPDSVVSIGYAAFYNCSKLTDIDIPSSVAVIGEYAFANCVSLENIKLPADIEIINQGVFANCKSLSSIKVPNGVTHIGQWAFTRCDNLSSIDLPYTLTSLAYKVFNNSPITNINYNGYLTDFMNIDKLSISDLIVNNPSINCHNSYNDSIEYSDSPSPSTYFIIDDHSAIIGLTNEGRNATKIVVPETINGIKISRIGFAAFAQSDKLNKIILPDTITYIEDSAFCGCTNLTEVILSNNIDTIRPFTFFNCNKLEKINIPSSVKIIGYCAFKDCINLLEVTMSKNIELMHKHSFENCHTNMTIIAV